MSIPPHTTISEALRSQIEAGDYSPGEKLPSEHQLMATFDVSRITARHAIANLVHQDLAHTQCGKGAFVMSKPKIAYSLSSPLIFLEQDLAQKGAHLAFENLMFRGVIPSKQTCAILQLTGQVKVYVQKKLLQMDGAAGAVDISYLLAELGQRVATQLPHNMTFPILEKNNIPIGHMSALIEGTQADYYDEQVP